MKEVSNAIVYSKLSAEVDNNNDTNIIDNNHNDDNINDNSININNEENNNEMNDKNNKDISIQDTTTNKRSLLGIEVLIGSHKDVYLLMLTKALRLFAFGFLAVMLVLYLSEISFSMETIGTMFSLTLIGDAGISLLITSNADFYGRRKMLLIGGFLAVITSFIFIISTNFWILTLVATFGVISPSGNEIGPFMAIELSSISEICADKDRTRLMAWYNLFGAFSTAFGSLFCGLLLTIFTNTLHLSLLTSYRGVLLFYIMIKIILCYCFYQLSPAIEIKINNTTKKSNNMFLGLHKSQMIVAKLSILFMLDSFAGSLILQSLIVNWFHLVWKTQPSKLGAIIFICNILAGISALFAARLADFIGLIMTMVVTHLPSNVMIMLVPLIPNETLAIVMLCARFSISQMDVPTRNAFVQEVVCADERSAANGVTNIVRSIGASIGPYIAGIMYNDKRFISYPFYIAGILKIIYDLLLLYSFHSVKSSQVS